jgi:hypothetical protein
VNQFGGVIFTRRGISCPADVKAKRVAAIDNASFAA